MSNISITLSGTGSGTVTSVALPTLSCPGTCTVGHPTIGFPPYNFDLIATPNPGSAFVGWTVTNQGGGDLTPITSSNTPQIFTYNNSDSNYTINAEFSAIQCTPIIITNPGPFEYTLNQPFGPVTLTVIGGTPPYTFFFNPDFECGETPCPVSPIFPPGISIGLSTGTISGTPTAAAPCELIPISVVDSNQCSTTTCIQMIDDEPPIQICYYLVPCSGGLTLIVSNNLALYVDQVIQILGQCFTVLLAPNCIGSVLLPDPIITVFDDCCSCNVPRCYQLTDCSLQTPQILTNTDLSQYLDKTIKVCDFNGTVGVPIIPVPTVCPLSTLGFVTQVTGSTSGFYFDENGPIVTPYTNPLTIPLAPGQAVCVNILAPFDVIAAGTSDIYTVQYLLGAVPITNPISISPEMSIVSAQFFIDQQIIYPNTTVTVTGFTALTGLVVDINIQSPVEDQLVAVLTQPASQFPPTITVTSDFSGSCICYNVTELAPNCNCGVPFTGIISGFFLDCECCNPPPIVPEPPYIPTPPEIDKHTYKICESQCDIDANKEFASAMYDVFKQKAYGIESCCPFNINLVWLRKELSDLSKIKC